MPLFNNPAGARRNAKRKAAAILAAKKEEMALLRKRRRRKAKREYKIANLKEGHPNHHKERPYTKAEKSDKEFYAQLLKDHKPQEAQREFARAYAERYVDYTEDASPDTIYDEWFTLAFDGLVKVGVDHVTARDAAQYVATCHAQP